MGDQVYTLGHEMIMPVEPSGNLSAGWVAGTWVKIIAAPVSNFSRAICKVERSNGVGTKLGFLMHGPQHNQPVERLSDMFTDTARSGGDSRKDWTAKNASMNYTFDKNKQLQSVGTRIATVAISNEGIFKTYNFETLNKQERNFPGTGATLIYNAGDLMYVSENGLFTNEQESVLHIYSGYGLFKVSQDDEGNYLIVGEMQP